MKKIKGKLQKHAPSGAGRGLVVYSIKTRLEQWNAMVRTDEEKQETLDVLSELEKLNEK